MKKLSELFLDLFAPPPAPASRTEDEVLAAVQRAGGRYQRVVFTRNRRIMASVGRDRSVLRLNEAFASAPEEVLEAVAVLFTARGRRRIA
ncbi:MAG TPA: hypothetical protein VFX98_00565, partial [Longimicrobiaceae bacterium]|nr:hypothetical protein [Longimicrobiaceae bacterium]